MNTTGYFQQYFETLSQRILSLDSSELEEAAEIILRTHKSGGKLVVVGNGGSAAMASHVAVDFTKAAGIRAVNFNEATLVTCFSNDCGYEHWVAKALECYADPEDLAIFISSSGSSSNILEGARQAKFMGIPAITLSGFSANNPLRGLGDLNLWVDSPSYNIVEMTHHVWLVAIIDYLIETTRR